MGAIYDTMVRYFDRIDWSYAPIEGETAVVLRFDGDDDGWSCVGQALEDQQVLLFFSLLPVDVPAGRLPAVAELAARANFGMLTGAFEVSFDTGDVRFRTSVRLEALDDGAYAELGLAEQLVHETVRTNVVTMNAYVGGLRAVVAGDAPAAAIARIEGTAGA